MAGFPTDSCLLGDWWWCFLLQALDWIQETGEYYLSTHTSTGETTEETQELLKEYGEFRVPAKVGSIPAPPQVLLVLPFVGTFSLWQQKQSLDTEPGSPRAQGKHVWGYLPWNLNLPKLHLQPGSRLLRPLIIMLQILGSPLFS